MYKLILIVFSCILFQSSVAQMFQSIGTTWYYEVKPSVGCFPCITSFQKIEYTGDTIINNKQCKKLVKSGTLTFCSDNESIYEYLYEENNIVYWYNASNLNFTILYNFNSQVNESWTVNVYDCSFDVHVDSISYSNYNGNLLKNSYVSDVNNYFSGDIIENIGNSYSFFPRDIYWKCRYNSACDAPFIKGIRCFSDSLLGFIEFNNLDCDTIYSSLPNNFMSGSVANFIQISPNPCNQYFLLTIPDRYFDESYFILTISNLEGQILIEHEITNQFYSIDVSSLNSGLYIVRLMNRKLSFSQKLIKR